MNKKKALKKLSDLEKETAELRKIIEKPEKKAKRERVRDKVYYFINNGGKIGYNIEYFDIYDDFFYNRFNYFATPEEAEEALELKKIENKLTNVPMISLIVKMKVNINILFILYIIPVNFKRLLS